MPTRTILNDGRVCQTFTATESWTVPAGVESVQVECWGGGGGGRPGAVLGASGGGGGGGAYSRTPTVAVTPGETLTVTVGAGGAAGAAGGDSWFRSAATVMAKGGSSGANANAGAAGGTAAASVGTTRFSGGNGGTASGGSGGGGGGGAGDANNGGNGGAPPAAGAGGVTGGGSGGVGATTAASAGVGVAPGGAGGGGDNAINIGSQPGARGQVLVTYVEVAVLVTTSAHASSESLAQTQDMTTASAYTTQESIADTVEMTTTAQLAADDALAETHDMATIARHQQNAARVSPGLGGTSRNASGTAPVLGAEVIVFRDDTNEPVVELVSDPDWASELDPAHTYWISYWKSGTPDRGYRTNRDIPTVETIVQIDASGDTGPPADTPYVLGDGDDPVEDIDGYLTAFGPQTGVGGDVIVKRPLYLFDD